MRRWSRRLGVRRAGVRRLVGRGRGPGREVRGRGRGVWLRSLRLRLKVEGKDKERVRVRVRVSNRDERRSSAHSVRLRESPRLRWTRASKRSSST